LKQSSSSEANSHSTSQDIPCLLWKPKVHYRVHRSPPLIPNLNYDAPIATNWSASTKRVEYVT